MGKIDWLNIFREKADSIIVEVKNAKLNRNLMTSEINQQIKEFREFQEKAIVNRARQEDWNNEKLLDEVLLLTYSSYIVMLEYRNKIWPYEYMSFARRIGELWEPFCKLAFKYSIKELGLITPPDFLAVQRMLVQDTKDYISGLSVNDNVKKELNSYYSIPWQLVDSGGIQLGLDLHFEQNGVHYNCDFKSGFSSNEKGNTNRLLLVATIYRFIGKKEKTLLFVRQSEDENNHYLQTLKNSPCWDVYCADECYAAIQGFTGFNLRKWLDENADWSNDISSDFKKHLVANDLLKYLTW